MKQRYYRRLVFTVALLIAGGALIKIATSQSVPNPVSLQVLASHSGSYVGYVQPSIFPQYADLNKLFLQSQFVIMGIAGSNICKLSSDGTFITTDYQVTVQTVYKGGDVIPGSVITVSLLGGKTVFNQPDGTQTSAEIRAPWFKKMTNGSQYYLFLTGSGVLINGQPMPHPQPTGGPQGVFLIANGVVTTNSGRLHDPMWQYNNLALTTFQSKVQQAISASSLPVQTPVPR